MTSNLTNDMTRLCGQIAALRDSRADLMSHLAETRAEMQATISQMVGGFGEARSEMARQTKAELGGFVGRVKEAVTELREKVAGLQEEFREDLAGAHRAGFATRRRDRRRKTVGRTKPGLAEVDVTV